MNHVELYTIRDQLNIEIKFKLKVHVAKWSYGLRFHMMVHQYYHFQFYFSAIHFISPAEISSGSSVIESPACDPNPGFTTYPGLEITIFSRESRGLPGFYLGSPGNFQGALWDALDFFEGAQMNFREPILTRPK